MTARDLLARAGGVLAAARPGSARALRWAWDHRTLVLAVLVVLLAALSVRSCRRASTAEAGAAAAERRAGGEARAEAAGIPVVRQLAPPAVDEARARLEAENPVLRARLARAEQDLGRLEVELAARIRTEPAPVEGPPRPPQPAGEAPRPAALLLGDQLRLGADLVIARTPAGAHVLEGTLDATRVLDGALLARQPYSAPVTWATEVAAEKGCPALEDRAWRAGPVGGGSGQGWLAGGAYARRVDVWGAKPEIVVTGAAGPGGVVLLGGVLF